MLFLSQLISQKPNPIATVMDGLEYIHYCEIFLSAIEIIAIL